MAAQNYRERKIGCHVVLKAKERQIASILLRKAEDLSSSITELIDFPVDSWQQDPITLCKVWRKAENLFHIYGYEPWEDVNNMKIPADLLKLIEYILEKELYCSLSIRHEEEGIKEEIVK